MRNAPVGCGELAKCDRRTCNHGAAGIGYCTADLSSLIHWAAVVFDVDIQDAMASTLINQASGASFNVGNKIVPAMECPIGTRAAHKVDVAYPTPRRRFDMQRCIPGVARMRGIDQCRDVRRRCALILPDLFAELCREIAHLIEEGRHVALLVFEVLVLRQTAAKLGVELRRSSHLGGGEKSAGCPILLISAAIFYGFDGARQRERVDLIARLHHLLFQVEECFRKARLLLRQSEDGFIHDLQAERSADAFPMRVGNAEADTRIAAWFVAGCVGRGFNLQLVRRLHENQAMIGDWLGIAAEEVGVDVERAGHLRSGRERKLRLPVLQVEIAGQNRLPIAHDVNVGRAASAGG